MITSVKTSGIKCGMGMRVCVGNEGKWWRTHAGEKWGILVR